MLPGKISFLKIRVCIVDLFRSGHVGIKKESVRDQVVLMGDDPRYWAEVERILKRDSRLQANSVIENGEGTFILKILEGLYNITYIENILRFVFDKLDKNSKSGNGKKQQ